MDPVWKNAMAELETLAKVNGKKTPPMILTGRRSDFLKKVDVNAKIVQAKNIPLMNLTDLMDANRSSVKPHTPRPSVIALPIKKKQEQELNQSLSWRASPGSNNGHIEEQLIIPLDKMGCAIGKHFANVIRLEKTYGVVVIIPKRCGQVILLKGLANNVTAAQNDLLSRLGFPPCTVL